MTRADTSAGKLFSPRNIYMRCRPKQDLMDVIFLSIVQTQIHKYYLKLKTESKNIAFACYSVGTGRSSVEKPPESQTSRQLASSLTSAPNS
jgi:hypothetical protein